MENLAQVGDHWLIQGLIPGNSMQEIPLGTSWNLLLGEDQEIGIEYPEGRVQRSRFCSEEGSLLLQEGVKWEASPCMVYLELKERDPITFRLVSLPKPSHLPEVALENCIEIDLRRDLELLYKTPVSWELFNLSRLAAGFALTPDFEQLIALPLLREVDLYEHQVKTVKTVLQRFRGRGLLCDEVGLGKTVEACLVLLELIVRKLVRRTLILTPPSLVMQWQGELQRKFGLQFVTYDDPSFKAAGEEAWKMQDFIIASFHTAKLEPYRSWISREHWDMVIVDEAHHLRNSKTVLWKFASTLQKKYILLLTATPMQNSLDDLFNLVTLLKPGLLNTAKNFKQEFACKSDDFQVKNVERLHKLIAECMVRNRRATISVNFTKRFARTFRVTPSAEEESLYREVAEFVKGCLKLEKVSFPRMSLLALQKLMGSFPKAAAPLLKQMQETGKGTKEENEQLLSLANKSALLNDFMKVKRLMALLHEFSDKMVVFTQFRSTQDYLAATLEAHGYTVAVFHGGLTRLQKEEAIRQFSEKKQVLISTDSGSEGRNLQFCNAICNFDLPWNPMRIEQRIGRVSRLGQTRDVHIFNMVNANTIEDNVLRVLEAKVNLFEQVIGEMDMIMGNLEEDREFEEMIIDIWVKAQGSQQFSQEMEKFGDRLVHAKEEYLHQQAREDKLFGDKFIARD